MIEWLRPENRDPAVEIDGRTLPLAIRRHAGAKRLTMRLAPDGSEVRITLPLWGQTRDAIVFAQSRAEWLARQLERVPDAEPIGPGSVLFYRGSPLTIDWQAPLPRRPVIDGQRLLVGGPEKSLVRRIQRWMEGEASELLKADLEFYCERAGHAAPDLRLSRAQRRWGSCSSLNCIRINWRLVQAPDEVRRSVVAHEVAHLAHFDHSPAFYALLRDVYDGDLKAADRWLKREGRGLYAAFG